VKRSCILAENLSIVRVSCVGGGGDKSNESDIHPGNRGSGNHSIMAIQIKPSSKQTPNDVFSDTKSRQSAAKEIQCAHHKRGNDEESHLTQTYLMLDRALSEAQSQKELCKSRQQLHNNDDEITYVSSDDSLTDSRGCKRSRCGLSEDIHEMLLHSGKWFYDCFGDPKNKDVAENIVTAAEIGEEGAVFCCFGR
jgi:hypothetical protein